MPLLTHAQSRLQDDLRGLIAGEVRSDQVALSLYSTDGSLFEVRPQAVVWPRSTDDVVALVQYAAEKRIPLHPRGGGTGSTGGALGSGIILDFTRFMRRIIHVGNETISVQPGALRMRVNTILMREQGRIFGPDPGRFPSSTLGGILASDGAGLHWLRYGSPRDHLLGITMVLPSGRVLKLENDDFPIASIGGLSPLAHRFAEPLQDGRYAETLASDESIVRKVALARGIAFGLAHQIAEDTSRTIGLLPVEALAAQSRFPVDRFGYRLENVLRPNAPPGKNSNANPASGMQVDLLRLLCGSEGTLGIITEMKLRTVPAPRHRGAVVLCFNSLEKAMRAVDIILPCRPLLCELLDRRRIAMLCEWDRRFTPVFPNESEAVLLVGLEGDTPLELTEHLNDMTNTVRRIESLAFADRFLLTWEENELFRELLEKSESALFRMKRSAVALPILDDLAVPTDRLAATLLETQNIFKRHEGVVSFSGHVGHGHLRLQPILNRNCFRIDSVLRQIVEEIYDLVLEQKGTLSCEQVGGYAKSRYLSKQHPALYGAFVRIKKCFDPENIFNPGKVITDGVPWTSRFRPSIRFTRSAGTPDAVSSGVIAVQPNNSIETMEAPRQESSATTTAPDVQESSRASDSRRPLSSSGETGKTSGVFVNDISSTSKEHPPLRDQLELQLRWNPDRFIETTLRCNGCGRCRSRGSNVRMCPVFRVLPDEIATPRSKANLLRDVLEQTLPLNTLTSGLAKRVADTCLHCHTCRLECPAEVDVPQLAFRVKSAYAAAHGLSQSDRFFSHLDSLLRAFTLISCPVNWSLKNRFTRWLFEKLFHIPQGRKLPVLNKVTFLSKMQWLNRHIRMSRDAGPKVALFVDTYGNLFDTKLAEAAMKILKHNGIGVFVATRQRGSGLMSFACGDQYRAEKMARRNIAIFADAIRQGYEVVTLEPASAICLSKEYTYLYDDADTASVAAGTTDLCTYLYRLHLRGALETTFNPMAMTVGYHAPCRTIAAESLSLDLPTPAEALLNLVPELRVMRLERGCCGLAGSFGLKQETYRQSLHMGINLFRALRKPEIAIGSTECNACKMQMEQATKKTTLHPIKLLALAYGLISPDE